MERYYIRKSDCGFTPLDEFKDDFLKYVLEILVKSYEKEDAGNSILLRRLDRVGASLHYHKPTEIKRRSDV